MLRNRFPLFFQHGALTILNEVLSLNAQEYNREVAQARENAISSMKS